MSKRPKISERMKVQRLLDMAWKIGQPNVGTDFQRAPCCRICADHIAITDEIDWDHIHPVALGGLNIWQNIAPVHRACHRTKTFGTKATTANSDIGKISKERRIKRTQKFVVKKRKPGARRPKSSWPSRKMQSRSFQKREKNAA